MLRDNTDGVNPNDAFSNRCGDETEVGIIDLDNLRGRYVQLLLKFEFLPAAFHSPRVLVIYSFIAVRKIL